VRQFSRSLPGVTQGLAASEALGSLAHAVGASPTLTSMAWDGSWEQWDLTVLVLKYKSDPQICSKWFRVWVMSGDSVF